MNASIQEVVPELDDSIHSAAEIEADLSQLRLAGFPSQKTAFFADGLIRYCRKAEAALIECISHLDERDVNHLMSEYLFTDWRQRLFHAWPSEDARPLIRAELHARGLAEPGENVTLLNGTSLGQALPAVPHEPSLLRLSRLSLLAAGLIYMREHPPLSPSY